MKPMNRALVATALLVVPFSIVSRAEPSRVVVIGFDGADPKLVKQYMDEGLLPNLASLSKEGAFSPLMPTNPPQTPVSWSAFATGLNPGRTEVFDFLQRDQGTYIPDFALARRSKKTFLWGANNGWVAAGAVAVAIGLLLFFVVGLLSRRWRAASLVALVAFVGSTLGLRPLFGRWLPVETPDAISARKGTPFWRLAAEAGKTVRITHVPVTFPAENLPSGSSMISGLGVPDMRGYVGKPYLFTSSSSYSAGSNEFSLELNRLPAHRGAIETTIQGPTNYPFYVYAIDRARQEWRAQKLSRAEQAAKETELKEQLKSNGVPDHFALKLRFDVDDQQLRWAVGSGSGVLKVGEWSDWVILDFPVNPLVDKLQPLRGMARFKLLRLDDEVDLYMSPINFHPSCHPVPYSWPPTWAKQVSDSIGLFKTIGWQIDTWSYPTGVGGIDLFLEDMWDTVKRQQALLEEQLARKGADLYVQIFDFPDRAGHMLWHELDDKHPLFKPELAQKYREAMKAVYVKIDEVVGRARELAGKDALFLVVSDHGFSSFRRQINYNTWLYKHGYLALKGTVGQRNLEQLFEKDVSGVNVFEGIDWTHTQAWAMGLGSLYINLVGREPQGIVMPGEEYERIVREIKTGLEAEVDPVTGIHPIVHVYKREELYHDFDPGKIPDLRPSNAENYRVSWQDTLAGLSTEVFEDNTKTWSGDHCSLDPSLVKGIFFVNRPLAVEQPSILDIAPSILNEMGLKPDAALDGRIAWKPR